MAIEENSYAYLRIIGSGSVDLISKQMGVEPDEKSWSEGDPIPRRPTVSREFSSWRFNSGEEEGVPLDTHLRSLWRRIEPFEAKLFGLGSEFSRLLVCVAWFPSKNSEFNISAGHFSTAAYYRLELDFDFYFRDNFGHEDEGKGYASW